MNGQFKTIICPIDFSQPSEIALAQAAAIATQSEAALQLLFVVQPMPVSAFGDGMLFNELNALPDQSAQTAQALLAKMRDKHCAAIAARTSLHVVVGVPFVEIVRFAREAAADLIVMGSHGRTGIEHMMLGSVAERVVRKAPCSVLVVRDANRRFVMP